MTKTIREDPKSESRPYEEYSEKTGYPVVKKPRKKFGAESLHLSEVPWAWVFVACLVLALIVVIVFPVFQEKQKTQLILALEKRVAGLEQRLDQDRGEEILMQRIDSLESNVIEMRQRLLRQEQQLSERPDRRHSAGLPNETEPLPKKEELKPKQATETRYHEVAPGETLYRISRRYGLSVDVLQQLNGLSDGSLIHPGQKLIVSTP